MCLQIVDVTYTISCLCSNSLNLLEPNSSKFRSVNIFIQIHAFKYATDISHFCFRAFVATGHLAFLLRVAGGLRRASISSYRAKRPFVIPWHRAHLIVKSHQSRDLLVEYCIPS